MHPEMQGHTHKTQKVTPNMPVTSPNTKLVTHPVPNHQKGHTNRPPTPQMSHAPSPTTKKSHNAVPKHQQSHTKHTLAITKPGLFMHQQPHPVYVWNTVVDNVGGCVVYACVFVCVLCGWGRGHVGGDGGRGV